jgi:SAM-dependent methyltransferase
VALSQQTLPVLAVDGTFDAAVSTFDGLNYLTPADFAQALAVVAQSLRPGGWLIFDLHTEAMLGFTIANPVIKGEADGNSFVITSEVDVDQRICDARIQVTRARDSDTFIETHRQYFHTDLEVLAALDASGFDRVVVTDEYTEEPVGPGTLRASWVARRRPSG